MPKTIKDKYFEQFKANLDKAFEITKRKNAGYTAGLDDPFSNFRFGSIMASIPTKDPLTVEQTILSRMADKISRYKSLIVRPGAAYDESIADTLHDLMVYSNILLIWEQLGRPSFATLFPDDNDAEYPFADQTTPETGLIAQAGERVAKLFGWKPGN